MNDPIIGSDNEFDHDDLDATPDTQKLGKQKVRRIVTFLCPAGIYQLKVNNMNTRTKYEICSKLTVATRMTPLASLLLTLNMFYFCF